MIWNYKQDSPPNVKQQNLQNQISKNYFQREKKLLVGSGESMLGLLFFCYKSGLQGDHFPASDVGGPPTTVHRVQHVSESDALVPEETVGARTPSSSTRRRPTSIRSPPITNCWDSNPMGSFYTVPGEELLIIVFSSLKLGDVPRQIERSDDVPNWCFIKL